MQEVDSFQKRAKCPLHDAVLEGALGRIYFKNHLKLIILVAPSGCRFVTLVTIHVISFPVAS